MEYTLIRSSRKTISIQIKDGNLLVRAPRRMSQARIEAFLTEHRSWILSHIQKSRLSKAAAGEPLTEEEKKQLTTAAKTYIPARAAYYAQLLGVSYGRITIRCQKTRWGSCSAQGNLSFNCLLMLAPKEVLDSVVVHELCHRKQMNHSKAFYQEIYNVFPEYDLHHRWLKEHGEALLMRIPEKETAE